MAVLAPGVVGRFTEPAEMLEIALVPELADPGLVPLDADMLVVDLCHGVGRDLLEDGCLGVGLAALRSLGCILLLEGLA